MAFVPPDDPILIRVAREVSEDEFESDQLRADIDRMLNVAYGEQAEQTRAVLVGLAAPQIGLSKRIILVDRAADGHGTVGDLVLYLNPEITWASAELAEWYEGCFSTDRVCGVVTRPAAVRVTARSVDGDTIEAAPTGYVARIFQHEIDHLNGLEFVSRIQDDDKLHWVEPDEFHEYRDQEGWRTWQRTCPRETWRRIKGVIDD